VTHDIGTGGVCVWLRSTLAHYTVGGDRCTASPGTAIGTNIVAPRFCGLHNSAGPDDGAAVQGRERSISIAFFWNELSADPKGSMRNPTATTAALYARRMSMHERVRTVVARSIKLPPPLENKALLSKGGKIATQPTVFFAWSSPRTPSVNGNGGRAGRFLPACPRSACPHSPRDHGGETASDRYASSRFSSRTIEARTLQAIQIRRRHTASRRRRDGIEGI